jgi:penicillin-binding protein 1B
MRWRREIVGGALVGIVLAVVAVSVLPLGRSPELSRPGAAQALASPIYARPLVLTPGTRLTPQELEHHLQQTGYRRTDASPVHAGAWWRDGRHYTIVRRAFVHADGSRVSGPLDLRLDARGRVRELHENGRRVAHARLEPERLGWVDPLYARWQRPIGLEELPPRLVEALLAIEDRRFASHFGLDPPRIAGAAVANWRAGRVVQGGSTITQQLAKNLFLTPERSLVRKLREAWIALRLELGHSKEAILAAYVNEIYMGHADGLPIHGLAAAAWHHVGRLPQALDLAEVALLVGMIRAPSRYAPQRDPEAARARRNDVIDVLERHGLVEAEAAAAARGAALPARARVQRTRLAPHYLDAVRNALRARLAPEILARGDLVVHTTLDARAQRAAQRAVRDGVEALREIRPQLADVEIEAALVALDPQTGDVLAHVGGVDYARSQFDRVRSARRQPGSAFKPIVALAALAPEAAAGRVFTLASWLEDEPLELETDEGPWVPANHDGMYRGRVSLREAMEQSLNVPMARLGLALGPRRVVRVARLLGLESPLAPVPSLALGAAEITPLELARAYAVLAAGGRRAPVRWLRAVRDAQDQLLLDTPVRASRVVDAGPAYLVTSALRGAVERGTARRLRALGVVGPIAAKTGSTNDYRDAWLAGYTPEVATAVWIGRDRGDGIQAQGAVAALPIFADFVTRAGYARDDTPEQEPPLGIAEVAVDPNTGLRGGWRCPGEPELFLAGTAPRERCGFLTSWFRGMAGRPGVGAGPVSRRDDSDAGRTCSVRLDRVESMRVHDGGADYIYRVKGRAGQTARVWLAASVDERRHVVGPAVSVGVGRFRASVEIELDTAPERLTAVLELADGERCRHDRRLG